MSYARLNEIQMYFEDQGSGVPLVLVHGFSGSGELWESAIPTFATKYRVVVPDLRAHGRSSGSPDTIHHRWFAADLLALLDYLEIDRAHFVGHSSGGMSLLFIGTEHQHRIRTLSLVSATYTFDDFAKPRMRKIAADLENQPDDIENLQRIHGPFHGDEHWKVLRDAFRAFTEDPDELPFRPEDLSPITQPVLVIHGDRDELFPVNIPVDMYRAMPNAELCILPGTTHDLPAERFELFVQITSEFLDRHAKA